MTSVECLSTDGQFRLLDQHLLDSLSHPSFKLAVFMFIYER